MANYKVKERVDVDPKDGPPQVFRFYGDDFTPEQQDDMVKYARMAKAFMNKPFRSPLDIVGNIEWHEQFPYENFLFGNLGQLKRSFKLVDFGCGPGRMVNRVDKLFDRVDGIDISEYAIEYAREHYPNSNFYASSGLDVGTVTDNFYDVVFSTISMQHIPSRLIRTNILRGMYNTLKEGGWISLQMAYHPDYAAGKWSHDTEHASYTADFLGAQATNGHSDVVVNESDLETLKADVRDIGFNDVDITHCNVEKLYGNLNGTYHAPYWARDWIFIRGRK